MNSRVTETLGYANHFCICSCIPFGKKKNLCWDIVHTIKLIDLNCTIQQFTMYSQICINITKINFKTFLTILGTEKPIFISQCSPFPSKPPDISHTLLGMFCINRTAWYVVFHDWLLSLFSGFDHIARCISSSFKLLNDCWIIWIHCIFFKHSSAYRHSGCFYLLAIINNAPMNIHLHVLA